MPLRPQRHALRDGEPLGAQASAYEKAYQGSLGTVGQAKTTSPWGTLDQGGNAVEWTDTITPPPFGAKGHRVWRRLHGGIANAPVYQLWLSAVGLQPRTTPSTPPPTPGWAFASVCSALLNGLSKPIRRALGGPRGGRMATASPRVTPSLSTRLLARWLPVALLAWSRWRCRLGAAAAADTAAAGETNAGEPEQLAGRIGCIVRQSAHGSGCGIARALKGPGPFMGSRAIALSPDGRNVYVASSQSDAIAIFRRNPHNGVLAQPKGKGRRGCIAKPKAPTALGDRPRRAQLGRRQPRWPQRLRDLAGQQLDHHLSAQPEDRCAAPAAGERRLHCRSADPRLRVGRLSGPMSSSSAPRARTSTSAPFSATLSPPSTATRSRGTDPAPGQPAASPKRGEGCASGSPSAPRGPGDQRRRGDVYAASALSNAVVALRPTSRPAT